LFIQHTRFVIPFKSIMIIKSSNNSRCILISSIYNVSISFYTIIYILIKLRQDTEDFPFRTGILGFVSLWPLSNWEAAHQFIPGTAPPRTDVLIGTLSDRLSALLPAPLRPLLFSVFLAVEKSPIYTVIYVGDTPGIFPFSHIQ
jgi:hypothetical protein